VAELNAREAKLVQYLNEAYGKEKQLETALQAHIAMTQRPTYKRRLQEHLRETRSHARGVERRIRELGGTAETISVPGPDVVGEAAARVQEVAQRGAAMAQGPLHAVRGTGEQEKELKNAKTEFSDEAEEIATYTAIESLAQNVGDSQTATLARGIRRQEERMASFLQRLIPQLTRAVVQAEIPASQRNGGRRRSTRRTTGRTTARRSTSARGGRTARSRSTSRSGSTSRSRASTSRSRTATSRSRSSTARSRASGSRSSNRRTTSARGRSSRGGTTARGRSRATGRRSSQRSRATARS
jgi:ferritin-like metal-binding protein YciE